MFAADLSWTQDKTLLVGQKKEHVARKTTTSNSRPTTRSSQSNDAIQETRSPFKLPDLTRRFKSARTSSGTSNQSNRRNSNASSNSSSLTCSTIRSNVPSTNTSAFPDLGARSCENSSADHHGSRGDWVSPDVDAISQTVPATNPPMVIKTVSISIDNDKIYQPNMCNTDTRRSMWSAPDNWSASNISLEESEISWPMPPRMREPLRRNFSDSSTVISSTAAEANVLASHFKRLIVRMKTASPQVLLDRLQEDWGPCVDTAVMQDLRTEKLLWALSALDGDMLSHVDNLSHEQEHDYNQDGIIIHFGGTIADLHLSVFKSPESKIFLVSAQDKSKSTDSMDSAMVHHRIRFPGTIELPLNLPNSFVQTIFVSSMPTLLPGSTLPDFLKECFRLLQPNGILETRLINALPERSTLGPKLSVWLEDNLMIQLETEFRCARPYDVVPTWASKAGFRMPGGGPPALQRPVMLHAAVTADADLSIRVGSAVLREIWNDAWGSHLAEQDCRQSAWWDDEEIMQECIEFGTKWKVATFIVMKHVMK